MSLFVKESGSKDAPAIVFIHGGGISGWMWDHCVAQLKDYHCLVPDLPEHGNSSGIGPITIEDCARKVAELIRAKAPGGRAHVVGHSLGGQILVKLLATEPGVIDHAVVSSALLRPLPLPGLTSLVARASLPLARGRYFQKLQAQSYHIPAEDFETYYRDSLKITSRALGRILYENSAFRLPAGFPGVTVPTLALAGQKELKVVHDSVRDLTSAIPNSRGYLITDADHGYIFKEPEKFAGIVRAWISDKPLPDGTLIAINRQQG